MIPWSIQHYLGSVCGQCQKTAKIEDLKADACYYAELAWVCSDCMTKSIKEDKELKSKGAGSFKNLSNLL